MASSRNFDYVKRLGATEAFDYNSSSVKDDLLNAFKNRELAGVLDCIGSAAWAICVEVAQAS